ncbi:MAG TPA: transglutaminase-like domain-containing protein [Pseudonocardiaceae bacterium]|nr:transglutaminase-like domain-containing protein [Pseudonocardiaceae bacterium]
METDLDLLRQPTEFLDHDSPVVRDFVTAALPAGAEMTDIERATALYYTVRDTIRYEVYGVELSRAGLKASSIIKAGMGFCVHKSIVYAAAVRYVGIPSRIVYADVRNHLASERLRKLVGGDIFRYHSITSVHLEGKWVKATPVFNKLLCRLYQISPLDFDGRSDSLYHPYDEQGRRHMEFLQMRGEFDDVPYETVVDGIKQAHPLLFASSHTTAAGSLVGESAPTATT